MATEEMTEEEMFAVILAKLEEKNQKTHELLGEILSSVERMAENVSTLVAATDHNITRSDSGEPTATPTSSTPDSPTSSPPWVAAQVVPIATSELSPEAPTRCSTAGPNQDARVLVPADSSSASPTASPTSAPSPGVAAVVPVATPELPPATPARCSALGLYHAAPVPEPATTASTPPSASSTSISPQDVVLADHITTTKQPMATPVRCSMFGRNVDAGVVKLATTSLTSTPLPEAILISPAAATELHAMAMHSRRLAPTSMLNANPRQGTVSCLFNYDKGYGTSICSSQIVLWEMPHSTYAFLLNDGKFKAHTSTTEHVHLSECLRLHQPWPPPPLAHGHDYNLVPRPIPWPSFWCIRVVLLLMSPWPPPTPWKITSAGTKLPLAPWLSFIFGVSTVSRMPPWPPPGCKRVVLQLFACCEPGWLARLLREKCVHWKIWEYKKHSDVNEFLVLVDTMVEAVLRQLLTELAINPVQHHFQLKQGIIRYKDKIWLGHSLQLQQQIMHALHSSPIGGHSGFLVTYMRIKKLFTWPPPLQLKVPSEGADLQPMPWPFFFFYYSRGKASPKLLLLPASSACSTVLPLVHSGFQSYVLVLDDLSKEKLRQHLMVISLKVGVELLADADSNYCYLGAMINEPQMRVFVYDGSSCILILMPWLLSGCYCAKSYMEKSWIRSVPSISMHVLLSSPVSLWMEWCFHHEKTWKFMELDPMLELLENIVQADGCCRREVVELFQSNLQQRWLIHEILDKIILINGTFIMITYSWREELAPVQRPRPWPSFSFHKMDEHHQFYRCMSVFGQSVHQFMWHYYQLYLEGSWNQGKEQKQGDVLLAVSSVEKRPAPWPSFCFGGCQVGMFSKHQDLKAYRNILQMPGDPGEMLQQRLGDKPCFKEGRMSGTGLGLEGHHGLGLAHDCLATSSTREADGSWEEESKDQTDEPAASCGSRRAKARSYPLPLPFFLLLPNLYPEHSSSF